MGWFAYCDMLGWLGGAPSLMDSASYTPTPTSARPAMVATGSGPFLGTASVVPKVVLCACPFVISPCMTCSQCYLWLLHMFLRSGCEAATSVCLQFCFWWVPVHFHVRSTGSRFCHFGFLGFGCVFFLCSLPLVLFRSKVLGANNLSPTLESMSHQCTLLT